MPQYECDQCGACCKRLLVECDDIDLMREPKLQAVDRYYRDMTFDQALTVLQSVCKPVMSSARKHGRQKACRCYNPLKFELFAVHPRVCDIFDVTLLFKYFYKS